jgi:hypothetical protein
MEKIRLKNGQELELLPVGVSDNAVTKRRKFAFVTDMAYDDVYQAFADNNNISVIEHLSAAGEVLKTYADCTGLKQITRNIENGSYIVELSADEVERKIANLENSIVYTELALTEIYEMMLGGM